MAPTKLGDVITAVPQLGSSCSLILGHGTPGWGIKLMRLVSKQLRTAMLGMVEGYTLDFNWSGPSLREQIAMLAGCRLSCLRVIGPASTYDGFGCLGVSGWTNHTLFLSCFLTGMSLAIRSITRLEIDVPSFGSNSMDEVAVLLSQLAPACPAVQQLQITGDVGRGLLAALGASCSNLRYLEVMKGVSSDVLKEMQLILPGITECWVKHANIFSGHVCEARPLCLSLMSCTTLTKLDVGRSKLTIPMWNALPAGLEELCCSLSNEPLTCLKVFNSMTHFHCSCSPVTPSVTLLSLVAAIRMMPNLTCLLISSDRREGDARGTIAKGITEVFLLCAASAIPHLVYLHDRVSFGLEVVSKMNNALCAARIFQGIFLTLGLDMDVEDAIDEIVHMGEFLSLLPRFPAFTGLALSSHNVEPSFCSLTQSIEAAFPNLQALHLNCPACISSSDLKYLSPLTSLQHLLLYKAHVSPESLAVLCTRLPQLMTLQLNWCLEFSYSDGMSLAESLRDWGFAVSIGCMMTNVDAT